ncbi:MAG: tripartite tricarboxylate transporter substrate binding protein [Alcaligenaceae bacterium]|nr:tripartite tricarboxylate transporter substrate binding protein [Alcaligenaceae bacterium SAGV5]MPS50310.1 tripartite tricarboxylate transporter substrate binding protein [Alcaligenaceae bacterium SAGV3]MPT56475.1 tripartite tricarboxylate transporter substrate binding protein [Alcaligenaceae bacterium]
MNILARAAGAGLAVAVGLAAGPAAAADYPARTVKLIDAFSPGGSTDYMARYFASKAGDAWGQPVVVENRPGAAGQIGTSAVAKAAADGYTMLVLPNEIWSVAPLLYKNLPFDIGRDLTPVASIAKVPIVMTVHPSVAANTVGEFIDLARKNPGKLTFGSAGEGTLHHLSAELFQSMAGIQMVHVPYKGTAPAVADLLGGQIQLVFSPISAVLPHIKAGKLKALAVADTVPVAALPGVPPVAQAGVPGYASQLWVSVVGPKNLPREVVDKWGEQIQRVMLSADARATLAAQGIEPEYLPQQELARRFAADAAKWEKVIREAGIHVQ